MSKFTAIGSRRTIKSSLIVLCIGILLMGVSLGVSANSGKGLYADGKLFICEYEDRYIICDGWVLKGPNLSLFPSVEMGVKVTNYSNSSLGAVVYNRAAYVFWTTSNGYVQFGKMNPSAGGIGTTHTIATGQADHGASAAVMKDTIYVFTANHTFTSADGKQFAVAVSGSPPHMGTMLDAVTFFPAEGDSAKIMVVYLDGESILKYSIFDGTSFSTPEALPYPFELSLKMGNLVLGTSIGSHSAGARVLSIQFYGLTEQKASLFNTESHWGRWEYHLGTGRWVAPQNTNITTRMGFLAAAPASETVDLKGNMQLYHVVNLGGIWNFFESDYMIPQHNDGTWGWKGVPTSTLNPTNKDPGVAKKLQNLWTLVGVVLGPPPFALNGASDAKDPFILSNVQYGKDVSQSVTTTHTSSSTISVGSETTIQGGLGEANLDFSYAHGWTSSHGNTNEVEVATYYDFGPVDETAPDQGIHGWAIFNAPILLTQRFKNYAYDKTTYLGQDMYTTSTGGIVQQTANFNLQNPSVGSITDLFAGMDKYPFSTDLANWNKYNWNSGGSNNSDLWSVIFGDLSRPAVGALSQGVNTTQVYTATKSTTDSKGNSNSFSVEADVSFDILEGFSEGIKMGYSADFETTTQIETTITKSVSSSLNMPIPANIQGYVENLLIQPYWLQAKTKDAPWIPTGYNGNLPWAITWNVISYDTIGGGTTGVAPKPHFATGTFQTGMEKMDHYSIDTGYLSWLDENGIEMPLFMTADDFDTALGAVISGNGYVLPMNETSGKWIRQGEQWMWFSSPNIIQDAFDLTLDFANGTWSFKAQSYNLDNIFLIADRQVHIQLELQGVHQFSHWMKHDVKAIWNHEEIELAQEAVLSPYGVDASEGAYESGSEEGYIFLKGHILENESSFGDVEIIINGASVFIPLLSTEGFLDKLENSESVEYWESGISFGVDFKTGEWEVLIVEGLFDGDMAPKEGRMRVQMFIGGEQAFDQTMEILEHSSMLTFWGPLDAWKGNVIDASDSYKIGDTGPAGGFVFYVGDKHVGSHGLEAAPVDQATALQWYNGTYTNTEARGDGVGAGEMNTNLIIASQGGNSNSYAAGLCENLVINNAGIDYGDWYLPSKYELDLMYTNLHRNGLGDFTDTYYWSSTEVQSNLAWNQDFTNGWQFEPNKLDPLRVRAVRAF